MEREEWGKGGDCFTCGEAGHWARECPDAVLGCYTCGGDHLARDCPQGWEPGVPWEGWEPGVPWEGWEPKGKDKGWEPKGKDNTKGKGEQEVRAILLAQWSQRWQPGKTSRECFRCGADDHIKRDCPEGKGKGKKGRKGGKTLAKGLQTKQSMSPEGRPIVK